jgi:hypothetical protein
VVARDHEDVGAEVPEAGHELVELLQRFDLGVEVTVLAGGVGLFEVIEDEVELVPTLAHGFQLALVGPAPGRDVHAHELREAAVHGVDREGA